MQCLFICLMLVMFLLFCSFALVRLFQRPLSSLSHMFSFNKLLQKYVLMRCVQSCLGPLSLLSPYLSKEAYLLAFPHIHIIIFIRLSTSAFIMSKRDFPPMIGIHKPFLPNNTIALYVVF